MRVLIVNTSEKTGGAAVASKRLMEALNNNGVKAKMLVRDKETGDISVVELSHGWLQEWHFLWERLVIYCHNHFSRNHLFEMDIANSGTDITRLREFKEADIIHLGWINQGLLSLANIRKILDSGKPVVWTMHDMWPATALCHYTRGCDMYKTGCHDCQLLPGGGSANDLSCKTWNAKVRMLKEKHVYFVACSQWLAAEAKKSALLKGHDITSIPNPIDTRLFHPTDTNEARRALGLPEEKNIVLFVSQRVTDERKGMDYFKKACAIMAEKYSETAKQTVVAILGGHAKEVADKLALPAFPLGYVSDEHDIVDVYNAADVFVLPSLEDNLPNTIMESMACGVPCVCFNVGGIPEMIDHRQNGYVATLRDAEDLAAGMNWILKEADYTGLSANAVKKVATRYSQNNVAMKYAEIYTQAIATKTYNII